MMEAAEAWQVDRSTMPIRTVAKRGALDALASSRPGTPAAERDHELEAARADAARLGEALQEMAVKLMLGEGNGLWGARQPPGRRPIPSALPPPRPTRPRPRRRLPGAGPPTARADPPPGRPGRPAPPADPFAPPRRRRRPRRHHRLRPSRPTSGHAHLATTRK